MFAPKPESAWENAHGTVHRDEDNDFVRIGSAMGQFQARIFIDDSASTSIMEIRTKARRLQMEKGLICWLSTTSA